MATNREQEVNREVGKRIGDRILALGRDQSDVARQAGIERSNLNRMLQGKRRVSAANIRALAKALECSPGELIGDEGAQTGRSGETIGDFLAACGDDDLTGRERRVFAAMQSRLGALRAPRSEWFQLRDDIRRELAGGHQSSGGHQSP